MPTTGPRYTPLVQLISILETAFSLFLSNCVSAFLSFFLPFYVYILVFFFFFFLSAYKQQASSVRLTTCTSSRCFIRRRPLSRLVSLNPGISVISLIGNRSCDLQCLVRSIPAIKCVFTANRQPCQTFTLERKFPVSFLSLFFLFLFSY